MNERITPGMNGIEMLVTMSEGNPGALNVLMTMLNRPDLAIDILLCDSLGIRGSKLYMLHNDCCGRDNDKFKRTLTMLRHGIFSEAEIQRNLSLVRALPFIDDRITIEGVPPYGEEFDSTHPKWNEFCEKNRKAFLERINQFDPPGGPKM